MNASRVGSRQGKGGHQYSERGGMASGRTNQGVDELTSKMSSMSINYLDSHTYARIPAAVKNFVAENLPYLKSALKESRGNDFAMFNATLFDIISISPNPYWTTLYLVALEARNQNEGCITRILYRFGAFLESTKKSPIPFAEDLKEASQIKRFAFVVMFRQKSTKVRDTITKLYKLHEKPDIFLEVIEYDIEARCYDIAACGAGYFKLQGYFEIDELLLPLLLENNYQEMYAYLDGAVEEQRKFVKYLDHMCNDSFDLISFIEHMGGFVKNQQAFSTQGGMTKTVNRFIQRYNIPAQYYPNVAQYQACGTIRYLVRRFYETAGIPEEDFAAMLIELVAGNAKFERELLSECRRFDVKGAAWFAVKLKMPRNQLPHEVTIAIDNGTFSKPARRGLPSPPKTMLSNDLITYDDWKNRGKRCRYPNYSPILPAAVYYVTEPHQFVTEVAKMLKRTNIVAIDAEWKPVFNSSPQRLSLLQMATEEVIIVVDILKMGPVMTNQEWSGFMELVSDPHMLKLGFCFGQDMNALASAHVALKEIDKCFVNLLDLHKLCSGILKKNPELFPYYGPVAKEKTKGKQSLEAFTQLCLGVALDKKEQFSMWNRRPLRESQKVYAAADVHCLIDIYRVLQARAREDQIYDLKEYLLKDVAAPTGSGDEDDSYKMHKRQ